MKLAVHTGKTSLRKSAPGPPVQMHLALSGEKENRLPVRVPSALPRVLRGTWRSWTHHVRRALTHRPGYPRCVQGPTTSPGNLLGMQILKPLPDPLKWKCWGEASHLGLKCPLGDADTCYTSRITILDPGLTPLSKSNTN